MACVVFLVSRALLRSVAVYTLLCGMISCTYHSPTLAVCEGAQCPGDEGLAGVVQVVPEQTEVVVDVEAGFDLNSSLLLFGVRHDSVSPRDGSFSGQLLDSNQVVFKRVAPEQLPINAVITYFIVEYPAFQVQRGNVDIPDASATVMLPVVVDRTRSVAMASHRSGGATYNRDDWLRVEFSDDTQLHLDFGWNDGYPDTTAEWQVLEFAAESGGSVQSGTVVSWPGLVAEHGQAFLVDGEAVPESAVS